MRIRTIHILVTLFLIAISASGPTFAQGKIIINEIMQSNVDYLMVDHDFPDSWVELHNTGDTRVSIKGYRLGPTSVLGETLAISSTDEYIEPGGHLVVYCDKTSGIPLHCNFNLESGKGKLYLMNDNWQWIDSVAYKSMPAPNVAYGRVTDGSSEWQHEMTPTPGAANNSKECVGVLPQPQFSTEGHVMTNGPETITISMPWGVPGDTRIYITTDGSEPNWDSLSDTLFTLTIDKSTVVRAKLLSHHMHPVLSTTHSYIFHPRDTSLPIISIATDSTYLYSSEEGILSNDSTDGKPNYTYDWRRPANFEYFSTSSGTTFFNQYGEMAVQGGVTRKYKQKGLKLYAKKRFSEKDFKGSFWRDKPEVRTVKSFILRTGGNNCLKSRIDDAFLQKMFGTNLDSIDWQAYEPVIAYINGQYKGVFGMRERSNEDYVTSNYPIKEEDIETADANHYRRETNPLFNPFRASYHREDVTYDELAQQMNVENFMNSFIAECYASNTDFPNNNVSMWKQATENGRWHWILKDLDFISINDHTWNMFNYILGTSDPKSQEYEQATIWYNRTCSKLYEKMMSFPQFRNNFIASYATYLGDFMRPEICVPVIRKMDEEIIDEIAPTFAAYSNMSTLQLHTIYIDRLCDYATNRPNYVYRQMADYFSLGKVIPLSIAAQYGNDSETDETCISVCNIPLRTGRFDGAWFSSFPLSISSSNCNTSWTMTVKHADGRISTQVSDAQYIQPDLASLELGDSVAIIATDSIATAITSPNIIDKHAITAIYDATGKKSQTVQKGFNIILYSDGTRKKIFHK